MRGTNSDSSRRNAIKSSPAIREQIAAIEAKYARKREEVEEYYANQFFRLRENAEIALMQLDAADRAAYARFIEQMNSSAGAVSATDGLHTGAIGTPFEGGPASGYEHQVRELHNETDGQMSEYKMDFEHLQKRRMCQLSDLEKAKKLEIEAVYDYAGRSAKPVAPKAKGTVTAILYSSEDASFSIDGEVLRAGQSIRGVKVVQINQDSVEFEYAGTRWRQKVNEAPSTKWP